jgi:hypothetical protein
MPMCKYANRYAQEPAHIIQRTLTIVTICTFSNWHIRFVGKDGFEPPNS